MPAVHSILSDEVYEAQHAWEPHSQQELLHLGDLAASTSASASALSPTGGQRQHQAQAQAQARAHHPMLATSVSLQDFGGSTSSNTHSLSQEIERLLLRGLGSTHSTGNGNSDDGSGSGDGGSDVGGGAPARAEGSRSGLAQDEAARVNARLREKNEQRRRSEAEDINAQILQAEKQRARAKAKEDKAAQAAAEAAKQDEMRQVNDRMRVTREPPPPPPQAKPPRPELSHGAIIDWQIKNSWR